HQHRTKQEREREIIVPLRTSKRLSGRRRGGVRRGRVGNRSERTKQGTRKSLGHRLWRRTTSRRPRRYLIAFHDRPSDQACPSSSPPPASASASSHTARSARASR